MDSGNHVVDVEDAVLSGKVGYKNQDFVLLLQSNSLVFREFATDHKGFTISMDQIFSVFIDSPTSKEFILEAVIPRSANDPTKIQALFHVKCPSIEEAIEWVETIQSVMTDRQLRSIRQDEEQKAMMENVKFENIMELKGMFPNLDDEIIKGVFAQNGGNMDTSINALLSISDPNYTPQPSTDRSIEEQMRLDEQLAIMLQDELFIQQLRNDGSMSRDLNDKGSGDKDDFSTISSKIQEMSVATKKKFMEYYNKFKKGGDKEESVGEELMPLKDRASYEYDEEEREEEEKLERKAESKTNIQVQPTKSPVNQKTQNLIDFDDDGL